MKRMLVILMVLSLFSVTAALAGEQAKPLSVEELNGFTEGLIAQALSDKAQVELTPEGFVAEGDGYTLYLTSEDLSRDSLLISAALTGDVHDAAPLTGPRGLRAGASLADVLAAYPDDNAVMAGTPTSAVLYIAGNLPEPVHLGLVTRDGQLVKLVEHSIYQSVDGGVMRVGLQYTIENDQVTAIRYFGGGDLLSLEEAQENLQALALLQEENSYFAYDTKDPAPFGREDLTVAGLDFIELTPEAAIGQLGEAVNEERVKDSNGDELRTMQWDSMTIAFVYDKDGQLKGPGRVSLTGAGVEGPRGLRIGTSLQDAISRFAGAAIDTALGGTLYGDAEKQVPPYGRLIVDAQTAQLYYALTYEDRTILLSSEFIDGALAALSISY
jgi:hypothetical protein